MKQLQTIEDIQFLVVDLFCGAGGTTTGFERAALITPSGRAKICKVIACVNHDPVAIESHTANHPETLHFTEDITTLNLTELVAHVRAMQALYPNAKLILWASLECTNFSNAKGGKPRDADSRSLADHMPRYIEALNPDYFWVENVREFMAWGPLNAQGKPESRTKGRDYQRWIREICDFGYVHDHRLLNAADFGAYTSRLRYFGAFSRHGLQMVWPEPTHARNAAKTPAQSGLFNRLQPWKPVREVLDFSDEGMSIFSPKRKVPLKEKTLERIYAGLIKHIAKGDTAFLSKYYSGDPQSKNISVDGPSGAMTTTDSHALVQPAFLVKYLGNDAKTGINNGVSVDEPCVAVTTQNRLYLAQANFLDSYYGNSSSLSTEGPATTLTTRDRLSLVQTEGFVFNPGWFGNSSGLDAPSPTVVARQDKAPISVVHAQTFLDQQYGNSQPATVDGPAATLTANPKLNLVQAFITQRNGQDIDCRNSSLEEPAKTITTTGGNMELVQAVDVKRFITNYYSGGGQTQSVDEPTTSLTTIPKQRVVTTESLLLTNQHCNTPRSTDEVAPTLLTGNHHYLLNAQFNHSLRSLDLVHPTLTADRHWPYLVITQCGQLAIEVLPTDSPTTVRIKQFMAAYGIIDIKMRMLKISELKRIQGFGDDYLLKGTQTDQKKFIGNAVHPDVPQSMAETLAKRLRKLVNVPYLH